MGDTSLLTITSRLIMPALLLLGLQTYIPAFSQTNAIAPHEINSPGYFYTGNDYLEQTKSSQQTYLAGIIDGFEAMSILTFNALNTSCGGLSPFVKSDGRS